jgi:hypothetical protein
MRVADEHHSTTEEARTDSDRAARAITIGQASGRKAQSAVYKYVQGVRQRETAPAPSRISRDVVHEDTEAELDSIGDEQHREGRDHHKPAVEDLRAPLDPGGRRRDDLRRGSIECVSARENAHDDAGEVRIKDPGFRQPLVIA